MKPDVAAINIAIKDFEHLSPKWLDKLLAMKEEELANSGISMAGSGRVLELKTEIAAIKKLLRMRR